MMMSRAGVIFCDLSTKRPHAYGLLGTASLGPAVQIDQIAKEDLSRAVTQCWKKLVANNGNPAQPVYSLPSSRNPSLPPTRRVERRKRQQEDVMITRPARNVLGMLVYTIWWSDRGGLTWKLFPYSVIAFNMVRWGFLYLRHFNSNVKKTIEKEPFIYRIRTLVYCNNGLYPFSKSLS